LHPPFDNVGDVHHHWKDKLCNGFKKPTGLSGGARDFTLKCKQVQRLIHNSMEAKLIGASSLNGDNDYSSSDDDVAPNFQEDEMPWLDEEENQKPKESDTIASCTTQEEAEQPDMPPSPPRCTSPVNPTPATLTINKSLSIKTKNSINNRRSNVCISIEHLCDSIAKSSDALFLSPHRTSASDGTSNKNAEQKTMIKILWGKQQKSNITYVICIVWT